MHASSGATPGNKLRNLDHLEQLLDDLEEVVEMLGRGDWRRATEALHVGLDAGDDETAVGVVFCLRCVCRCMWLQCAFGDVEKALGELEKATARLGRLGVGVVRSGRLPAEPFREELPLRHLIWVTNRLVLRERADIEAVRLIFGDLRRGRPELIYACVEYLTWADFDPWTVRVHPRDQELLSLDDEEYARFRTGNPVDISARATNLRHLADVRSGCVARRTWHRMGGYGAVREAALLVLAGEPVTRGRADCPIRLGRLRAHEYAQQWTKDTAA